MDARTILVELGGYREVAAGLGLSPTRVHNWTRRGIPGRFWPRLLALAQQKGRPQITLGVLERAGSGDEEEVGSGTTPSPQPQAAA